MKKTSNRRPRKALPVLQADGTVTMRVGVVVDACCCGIYMLPQTAEQLGFKRGEHLQVDHDERGTCIVRELVRCTRGCQGMQPDYIYLDGESAGYLNAELHEQVKLRVSPWAVDVP